MTRAVPRWTLPSLVALAMLGMLLLPPGENRGSDHSGYWDEARHEYVVEHEASAFGTTAGRIVGQFTFHFLLMSLLFAHARPLGRLPPRLRAGFHRGLGTALTLLAVAHAAILLPNDVWRGWLTGAVSFGVLVFHGSLGFAKGTYIRWWGPAWWRFAHHASAWTGLAVGVQHALFYGQHYGLLRETFFGS